MNKPILRRRFFAGLALAVACVLASGASAQAGTIAGSISLADIGTPTANTGNILTATMFTLGNVITTADSSGGYVVVPPGQVLGSAVINVSNGASFVLGNAAFGTFTGAAGPVTITTDPAEEAVAIHIAGTFVPGTDFPPGSTAPGATMDLSFTQVGGPGAPISASATLRSVPEPASMALLGIGISGFFAFRRFFKRTVVA
jgi:PEP-CTERM motif